MGNERVQARCETAERSERALQRQKKSAEAAWAKAGEDESTAYAAQVKKPAPLRVHTASPTASPYRLFTHQIAEWSRAHGRRLSKTDEARPLLAYTP